LVGSDDKRNTDKNMVARDVALISTDVDGKHDGYAIVSNIGLSYRAVSSESLETGLLYILSIHRIIGRVAQLIGKLRLCCLRTGYMQVTWLVGQAPSPDQCLATGTTDMSKYLPIRRHLVPHAAQDEASSSTHSAESQQIHC